MDAQNDLTNWISSIPKITRWWFFAFFIVPLTTRLGLLDPMSLVLISEPIFSGFQVSLLLTVSTQLPRCIDVHIDLCGNDML